VGDGRHAADGITRGLAHEGGVGAFYLLAQQRAHLLLVHALFARGDHQHRVAAGAFPTAAFT
jgi:hypothetical protein